MQDTSELSTPANSSTDTLIDLVASADPDKLMDALRAGKADDVSGVLGSSKEELGDLLLGMIEELTEDD